MTEAERERFVDRMLDHLLRLLLNGDMTQEVHERAVEDLFAWVKSGQPNGDHLTSDSRLPG